MVSGERAAWWLSRLVQIPSVTPGQAGARAGVPGEARMAAELQTILYDLGAEVQTAEVAPGRPNLYAIWRAPSDRWIGVDIHMDTVGVEQMSEEPFSGALRDGRVHGRGAVDTKATFGVVLALLEAMRERSLAPSANLLLIATMDEEDGGLGGKAAAQWLQSRGIQLDELAVAEPTGCAPVYAHNGVLRMEFQVQGRAAHSSQPQLGRNAIYAASKAVLNLAEEAQRLESVRLPHGNPALTVTRIEGGRGLNVVPDSCTFAIDRRVAPGEETEATARELADLALRGISLPVEVRTIKQVSAFFQDPESAWLRHLEEWSGHAPQTAPYCTNASAYRSVARECVVIGPGSIDQAHGREEWVEISELERMARIYARWWGLERR